MIAPQQTIQKDPTPEVLVAVRELLGRNSCAAHCGAEMISSLLYAECYLPYSAASHEVEWALEVLCVEDEVLA